MEDSPAAVRFGAVEAAAAHASVGKGFCEQQNNLEPSHLLAGTWFWLPETSCSLCLEESTKPPKPPSRSQIQMDNRLEEALLGAVLLTAQAAPPEWDCSCECLCYRAAAVPVPVRSASLSLPACVPAPEEHAISECRPVLHKPVSFFAWVQQTAAGQRGLVLCSNDAMC